MTASVSTHVPKPHTPFQWAAMDTEAETTRKQAILAEARAAAAGRPAACTRTTSRTSRGSSRAATGPARDLLERAFRLGCRFDGWDEGLRVELWEQALTEEQQASGFEPGRYLGTIPVSARLPWDHIDIGLEPDFLLKEYRKALKDRLSPPCGKPFKQLLHPNNVQTAEAERARKLVCYDCGVACDLAGHEGGAALLPAPHERLDAAARRRRRRHARAQPASRKTARPATAIVQGEPRRYRLRYTKLGRIAYLGHLDLIRHLPRIFRRAGLELLLLDRASIPSPSSASARRWGWASRRSASCST